MLKIDKMEKLKILFSRIRVIELFCSHFLSVLNFFNMYGYYKTHILRNDHKYK